MKNNLKAIVVLVNLVLVLAYLNWSVVQKEDILEEGELVLLKLAPVDPRSLMQGDYMRLSYAISQPNNQLWQEQQNVDSLINQVQQQQLTMDSLESRGYAVIKLDAQQVAQLVRYQPEKEPLHKDELLLKYTKGDWALNLGAESYFFEEGQAKTFEQAEYGGLRVDKQGNSVLVGLYDKNRKLLKPKKTGD
ncbi:GDYXXLXY domain-containing protein [Pontibacter sp. KCTC 32443]|uniref:GDYXXLXY domain-containing protein n=1 Tax=Pontibacter TaxID=323449 RepID=UPI00164E6AEC|nr:MULTISPECIES: GDYXXLXY domain-containing protein [Pontibacter]MBC5774258.1 GDYXXLXY domain-containing protein [Pontibacter sp. KCTC 32443]